MWTVTGNRLQVMEFMEITIPTVEDDFYNEI